MTTRRAFTGATTPGTDHDVAKAEPPDDVQSSVTTNGLHSNGQSDPIGEGTAANRLPPSSDEPVVQKRQAPKDRAPITRSISSGSRGRRPSTRAYTLETAVHRALSTVDDLEQGPMADLRAGSEPGEAVVRPPQRPAHRRSTNAARRHDTIAIAAATALVVLGAVLAFVVSSMRADVWEARAELEYRGRSFVETAAITASSRTEIAAVAATFDVPVDEVEERFSVVQAPNTEILDLAYTDEDPDRSLALLQAMTAVIVERTTGSGTADQIALVERELARLGDTLVAREDRVAVLDATDPESAALAAGMEELTVLRRQIADLEIRRVDLELQQIEETPVLVTEPYLVPDPVGPSPLRQALLGGIVGLGVAAAVLALARRR